ncbi:MAG: UDP-glucose dehydrogenase family protein [Candidatus Nanopelagicales bacterium]
MKLSVLGCGYLGAVHAASMAVLGFEVVGIDVDEAKVASLQAGLPPFYEPGFDETLAQGLASGRLSFTTDYAAAADADVHFLCVGTPQRPGELAADLTYVFAAAGSLAPLLSRPALVVGKSTVPVGTAAELTALIHSLAPAGTAVDLAWNPEFLREGFAVQDTLHPDRIVIGVQTATAEALMRQVYASMIDEGIPLLVMDLPTAELVKVAANSFLATKISFINAMGEICEATGADVTKLADAIGFDARIGRRFLNAGIGFGGGCLPKDIRAFTARAQELGMGDAVGFLHEVDAINTRRRARAVEMTRNFLGGTIAGKNVCVLGAAFKPDSDDVRDSPALDIAQMLSGAGANLRIHDPKALANAAKRFPTLTMCEDINHALRDADVVLHLTEWKQYRELDPAQAAKLVRHAQLVEGRNALDVEAWRAAGWRVVSVGRAH